MKSLSKSEKILISILLVMLIGYVYYQFVITPISIRLNTVQNSISNLEQELLSVKLMEASTKMLGEDMNTIKSDYEKNLMLMPKSDMSAQLLRDVNRLAIENKVILNQVILGNGAEYKTAADTSNAASASNTVNNENTQKGATQTSNLKVMAIPVTLNITGDYKSFISYINMLESNTRLTNINSFNIQKVLSEGNAQLTVNLNASVLYIQDGINSENEYDFNNGSYSKENPFK